MEQRSLGDLSFLTEGYVLSYHHAFSCDHQDIFTFDVHFCQRATSARSMDEVYNLASASINIRIPDIADMPVARRAIN